MSQYDNQRSIILTTAGKFRRFNSLRTQEENMF